VAAAPSYDCLPVIGPEGARSLIELQRMRHFKLLATPQAKLKRQPTGNPQIPFLHIPWIGVGMAGPEFKLTLRGQQFFFPRVQFGMFIRFWRENSKQSYLVKCCKS
jgi:hypothetical protein